MRGRVAVTLFLLAWSTVLAEQNIDKENESPNQENEVDSTLSDSMNSGFCEVELKTMRAAVKSLSTELSALRIALNVESSSKSEINRVWRLVRNQQAMIEKEFLNLNSQFSWKIRSANGVTTISTQNSTSMADLFFGGEPFFVQCATEVEPLHRSFTEAANDLVASGITPVALDCHEKLPSGKSTAERFFPGKTIARSESFFFVVANRQKPRSINMKSVVSSESLVNFIANATKPKMISVAGKEDFREHCLRRQQCAVVVYDGNMTSEEMSSLETVVLRHRRIAFVDIDLKKWSLSFEDALPQTGQAPRLVFLQLPRDDPSQKKKKNSPAKQFEGRAYKGSDWDTSKLSDFLEGVSTGKTKLAKLKKHPAISERVSPSAGKKSSDSSSKGSESPKKKGSASSKGEKAEPTKRSSPAPGASRPKPSSARSGRHTVDIGKDGNMRKSWEVQQEEKAAELQRERERRRQMEQESKAADGIEFVGDEGTADLLEDDTDEEGYTHLPPVEVDFDDDEADGDAVRGGGKRGEQEAADASDSGSKDGEDGLEESREAEAAPGKDGGQDLAADQPSSDDAPGDGGAEEGEQHTAEAESKDEDKAQQGGDERDAESTAGAEGRGGKEKSEPRPGKRGPDSRSDDRRAAPKEPDQGKERTPDGRARGDKKDEDKRRREGKRPREGRGSPDDEDKGDRGRAAEATSKKKGSRTQEKKERREERKAEPEAAKKASSSWLW